MNVERSETSWRHKILFVAANVRGMDSASLEVEAKAIQEELERSSLRDSFDFTTRWAVQPPDLLRELVRLRPTVVHFSGFGLPTPSTDSVNCNQHHGLYFQGTDDGAQYVSPAALEETFGAAGSCVKLVVLSRCYSEGYGTAVVSRVPCVIGLRASVPPRAATAFNAAFYGGLAESAPVGAAFAQGRAAFSLRGEAVEADDSVLMTAADVDIGRLCIVRRPTTQCTIVIRATLECFDPVVIERVRDQLRLLSGDVTLEIVEVKEGSVRLTVSLSSKGAARLSELRERGELAALEGFEVSSFRIDDVPAETAVREEPEPSADEVAMGRSSRAWHSPGGAPLVTPRLRPNIGSHALAGAYLPAVSHRTQSQGADDLVGRTLGEFVLHERIAEGGFSDVYRCYQPLLGREVVVKVISRRLRRNDVLLQRFLREAQLASRLDHPYAAHVYAFDVEPDGRCWIAMELVQGISLARWLRERGPLPLDRLVPFFECVTQVVQTAHDRGIIHRDLKPGNVMVIEGAGRLLPKLLDFGIAKLLDDDTQVSAGTARGGRTTSDVDPITSPFVSVDTLTGDEEGLAVGSPPYMSPEQWTDANTVGIATDLYALGVLAYEALTGRRPFNAATIAEYSHLHGAARVPPLGPSFPPALDRWFLRALAKRPEDRWTSAHEMAASFRDATA